jgi:hypothetical protein
MLGMCPCGGLITCSDLFPRMSILEGADVRKLPKLRLPRLPLASDNFESFVADIYREEAVQKVAISLGKVTRRAERTIRQPGQSSCSIAAADSMVTRN